MPLMFRAEPGSIPTFAGKAEKIYPSFISYDHIGQTLYAIWLKDIEQVCGDVNPECFLDIC